MSNVNDKNSGSKNKRQDVTKPHSTKDTEYSDLWKDGLVCAFELIRGQRMLNSDQMRAKTESATKTDNNKPKKKLLGDSANRGFNGNKNAAELKEERWRRMGSYWVPIGWDRITELVQLVQVDACWDMELIDFDEEEDDVTVAEVVGAYWERPAGPTWWCHVAIGHPNIESWLSNAQWLHPAISIALRDESRLISEKMKHLLYEVPVRVAGGLLFELLGQSVGDPVRDEDDVPIVLRSWQAQNFLLTALHLKGTAPTINVLGITEVQELLISGGITAPKSIHEVIAHLACRLSRWDDRLFRKYVFGAADEIELKFVNRRINEDINLLSVILNQEIKRLATQVIRVKWSLHAREEIVFELVQHLRGNAARIMLEGIKKSTREMMSEQEAVRERLFTIQDVTQSTVRAWLQDQSLRINHNLAVFGGCGLVLSIVTSLFGINLDGIPGSKNTRYAFGLFTALLCFTGIVLVGLCMLFLGLQSPASEEQVELRKSQLQELVNEFQHDAETHAKVREGASRKINLSNTITERGLSFLP